MITLSIGLALLLVNPGRMKLTYSYTEAARSNLCFFHLELYSSSRGLPWIYLITALGEPEVVGAAVVGPRDVSPLLPSEKTYCFKCPAFISFSTK